MRSDSEARMLEIMGHLEDELNFSEDPFVLDVVTAKLQSIQQSWRKAPPSTAEFGELSPKSLQKSSPSRKLQQVFEQALVQEAEEQAIHLQSTTSQFGGYQNQVQVPHPNPKVMYNPRGNPYLEGDPNLGYSLEDTRPRYNATGSTSHQPVMDSITDPLNSFPAHKSTTGLSHSQNQGYPIHTHQFNSKKSTGQVKPKPKNWAALL